jgi:hypothetical protein
MSAGFVHVCEKVGACSKMSLEHFASCMPQLRTVLLLRIAREIGFVVGDVLNPESLRTD